MEAFPVGLDVLDNVLIVRGIYAGLEDLVELAEVQSDSHGNDNHERRRGATGCNLFAEERRLFVAWA